MNKYGTETNLKHSPYCSLVYINNNEYLFYFSTQKRKERFEHQYKYFIDNVNKKLMCSFNVYIKSPDIGLIECYKSIEKHGYRMYKNMEEIKIDELCVELQMKIKSY